MPSRCHLVLWLVAAAATVPLASNARAAGTAGIDAGEGGGVEPDPFEAARTVVSFSFEADEDRDYDDLPDDWTRRRGAGFPHHVGVAIDRTRGRTGGASLRFEVDGGQAILYAPQVPIGGLHALFCEGWVRTQLLEHDAAIVSVSLLDHERRRVQRFTASPVTGTHGGWVRVRIGPMLPLPEVRFAVLACHLVHGEREGVELGRDFHGAVWFDDLWLGRTPRLSLETNFLEHFSEPRAEVEATARIGGIEPGTEHRLLFSLLDRHGDVVAAAERRIDSGAPPSGEPASPDSADPEDAQSPIVAEWQPPRPPNGFYRVRAELRRGDERLLVETATLVVLDLVEPAAGGEFGWAVPEAATERVDAERFAAVVEQAGVHWLKHPLWRLVSVDDERAVELARLFTALRLRQVRVVGVLEEPPPPLRERFAEEWVGTSEVFTLPPETWSPSLEPVLARFSSHVSHWQLGGDDDTSFVGLGRLDETLARVKREFDRIGRDSRFGVRWTWDAELPNLPGARGSFLSILERGELDPETLAARLEQSSAAPVERWAVLRPLPRSSVPLDTRASDLVRRMTLAKAAGATAVFAYDVHDPEHGLLNADNSPTALLPVWRTVATSLVGAEYLGRLRLPGGSTNHVFAREGEAIMVAWNDSPQAADEPVVEELYFGEAATVVDPWGLATPLDVDPATGAQRIPVGPVPVVVRGGNESLVRFRMAVALRTGTFDSSTGPQAEAVLGRNTFSQGLSGKATLVLGREWRADPTAWTFNVGAGEPIALETLLELPPNATLGPAPVAIDFELAADRPYRLRVHREIRVGTGDLTLDVVDRRLPDGRLEIEQVIVNRTQPLETFDLECSLFAPGQRRQRRFIARLGAGEDRRFYVLPDAAALRGRELWLRAREESGRRVLNYKWTVGENWDSPPPTRSPVTDTPRS